MSDTVIREDFPTRKLDNQEFELGTGGDTSMVHDGTDTIVTQATGNLVFDNTLGTGKIVQRLGTDDANTAAEIRNNSNSAVFSVNGAGTVTATGAMTASTLATSGNTVTVNNDASAAATNAPYIEFQDGDATAAPNDDLIKARVTLDAPNELIQLSMTRQRNGGATAQVGAHLSIGRVGEVTASVDAVLDLRSANDASAARVATITHLGQEGAVEVSSPTAGLDFALVGTGDLGIKASAADAQVSAGFSGSQVNLGAGGASAPDWVAARQAANVVELGSGDSAFIVGAASLGRRNASADANPTLAITANGLEGGAGGASATDAVISRTAANVWGLGAGDSLSISNTGELLNDRFVKVAINAVGGTGTNDGTLDVDVQTLDGTNVARAKKIKIIANSTEGSGETLDASITFSAATLGSIISSGSGFCYALTDATGNFACTLTNSADDTTYVSAMSSDGGVASAGQGCAVVESVIDSAVWAP